MFEARTQRTWANIHSTLQWKFDLSNFKLHRHFFLASYQLLLVSADNGCSKRNANQLMQPPSSLVTPTSLCKVAPSHKKYCGERGIFFLEGRGAVHRLGSTRHGFPLLSVTKNNVLWRMQGYIKKATSISSLATFVMRIIVPVIPSVFRDKWVQLSDS